MCALLHTVVRAKSLHLFLFKSQPPLQLQRDCTSSRVCFFDSRKKARCRLEVTSLKISATGPATHKFRQLKFHKNEQPDSFLAASACIHVQERPDPLHCDCVTASHFSNTSFPSRSLTQSHPVLSSPRPSSTRRLYLSLNSFMALAS
jgi:hypothetical protein